MDVPVEIRPLSHEASNEEEFGRLLGRQQALANLGLRALSGKDFSSLMDEAVELVAENLSVEYSVVLELLDGGKDLLLRSGVGLEEGAVGRVAVDTGSDLYTGYTLISRGPIIVGGFREERRFDISRLLGEDREATSGLSTAIYTEGRIFGLLGAYTTEQRWFSQEEARFLEAVAKVLGAANERELSERRAQLRIKEEAERAEAAERHFRLLCGANELVSASLGCAATLASTARLAVPALADLCFVDMVEVDTIDRLVVIHADYVEENLAHELRDNYPLSSSASHGTPKVLRTGRTEIIPEVGDGVLVDIAYDERHLRILRRLSPKSYMCVPFQVGRQLVGAIGFISAESGRRYDERDLALAEGFTRCAALAIDRALHHLPEAQMAGELIERARREEGVAPAANLKVAPELTARQLEVLRLLSRGKLAKEISEVLCLSETTVRNHIRALLQALGARSQIEGLARAREAGLLVG